MKDYVSLHNHTQFSISDSLIWPDELFDKAKELGQSAIAVTDHGTLSGAWECLKASKRTGVKLIMGCEFYFVDDVDAPSGKVRHVILLAKNHEGYKNLLKASKLGFDNSKLVFNKVMPRIDWKILEECSSGLICTTACGGGILGNLINTRQLDKAYEQANRLKDIFGENLALEIQPHAMKRMSNNYNDYEDQMLVNHQLIRMGDNLNIKVIAATDAHFLTRDKYEAHDVLLAIGSGQPVRSRGRLKYNEEFYMKSRDEVYDFFYKYYKEKANEFCDNTLFFANMCEEPDWIDPKYSNPSGKELPTFPVKDQSDYGHFKTWLEGQENDVKKLDEDVSYLRYWCDRALHNKIAPSDIKLYKDRLEEELEVIEFRGFSSYMLIVADILDFCRKNNIHTGDGRGSCGGCLIAFLTDIHKADPIKYGLIFARFLNKFKTAYPDIDVDISSAGRDTVKAYIRKKYGEDHVAHVSNINTVTAKPYAKDIARVFEFGGDRKSAVKIGMDLADSIPSDPNKKEWTSICYALDNAPLFAAYAESKKYNQLKRFAEDFDHLFKAWGTHAGGIIIGKRPLVSIVPLRRDKEGNIAIEYDKDNAEENGLVKIDALAISSLDKVIMTLELIKLSGKTVPTRHTDYDNPDQATYDLISRGDTLCVFQLGKSMGTVDLCRKIKPKTIEDIALINALARPSAKNIREDFRAVRDGEKPMHLLHPDLKRAFGETLGFGLYEECLMYLAQDIAGWDLHKADGLRKLTKEKGKNPKKAKQLRKDFITNSVEKGFDKKMATKIWDEVVDKFQGYGFNKSHAIFYSMLGYQTAYLKAHYPLEFLTANLMHEVKSNAQSAKDNIAKIKEEIRRMNVKIIPPDINKSEMSYKIVDENTLMTGLDALKSIGKNSIPEIIEKRPFYSFDNFIDNVEGRLVNSGSVKALASGGCLDTFGRTRRQMYLYIDDYKKKLQAWKKRKTKIGEFAYPWPEEECPEWTVAEKCAMEFHYLGEALSGGLKERYPGFFNNRALNFSNLPNLFPETTDPYNKYYINSEKDGIIQGVIVEMREFPVKKETSKYFGQQMAKIRIEGPYGNQIVLTAFPRKLEYFYRRVRELAGSKVKLEPGIGIYCAGYANWYEGDISIVFEELMRVAPIPPLPKDLKPRKVAIKSHTRKSRKKSKKADPDKILEELENELIDEGHADILS